MPGVAGLAIAGLWYVLLGLCSPLVALRRSRRGEYPRWHVAWRSFAVSAGMVAAFVATVWGLVAAVGRTQSPLGGQVVAASGANASTWEAFLRVGGFVGAILLAVLLTVQVLVVRQRRLLT